MRIKRKKIFKIAGLIFLVLFILALFYKPGNPELQSFSLQEWFRFPSKVEVSQMKYHIKVAATSLQTNPDKDTCLLQIINTLKEIKQTEPDTKLVVFGEASLGTYFNTEKQSIYQKSVAETIPGRITDTLGKIAKNLTTYIAIGLIEKVNDTLYNTMVVFDTSGNIAAKHRKQYLHQYDQMNGITKAGNNTETFYIDSFKIGLSICADANKKWLINEYCEKKIDILLYSVTSSVPWLVKQTEYWPMAAKYNSWIVASNRFGTEGSDNYSGFIFVADNKGAIQKMQNGKAGYVTTIIGKD